MQRLPRGYSLLELLAVLAIVAVLFTMGLPGLGSLLRAQAGEVAITDLARTLNFARAAAVTRHRLVTVCRSREGSRCGGEWQEGVLVFSDADGDREIDADDELLRYLTWPEPAGTLTLSSFPSRQYLQFTAEGFTNRQNGSFTWCPLDGAAQFAQQLVFTQAGRMRLGRDRDGDGIREDAEGRPLRCKG